MTGPTAWDTKTALHQMTAVSRSLRHAEATLNSILWGMSSSWITEDSRFCLRSAVGSGYSRVI